MGGNSSKLKENTINEEELALVEAALYVAGRPLGLGALGSILGTRSKKRVIKLAQGLVERAHAILTKKPQHPVIPLMKAGETP